MPSACGVGRVESNRETSVIQGHRVVFREVERVEVEPFSVESPGPDGILIETGLSLISPGTEGAILKGLPNAPRQFPICHGYSNIGNVLEVGANVKEVAPGDRVATHTTHASHVCVGKDALCEPVPPDLSSECAAFSTLASVAMQGVRKARIELGESVLVIGQGLVGNLALQLARLQGGYPVVAADLDEGRLGLARQVGADHVIREADVAAAVRELTRSDGARVVIEATGHPEVIVTALQAAGWCGRVVLLGSTRGETERVNFYQDVHIRGVTILGAHGPVRPVRDASPGFWPLDADVRLCLKLLAAGRIQVEPLLSERIPFRDARRAYDLVLDQRRDVLGIILDWRGAR